MRPAPRTRMFMFFGCWLLAVGSWLLAVGRWLLAVGCWSVAFYSANGQRSTANKGSTEARNVFAVGSWRLAVTSTANCQLSTANKRLDRRQKRLHIDRLRNVPVTSRLKKPVLVAAHGVCGQRQDGDLARALVALELLHHAQAVDAGQVNVHQDQIDRLAAARHRHRLLAACGLHDLISPLLQEELHELHVHLVVFDHQDPLHDGFFVTFCISGKTFVSKSTVAARRRFSTRSSVFWLRTRAAMALRTCSMGCVPCRRTRKMCTPKRDGVGSLISPSLSEKMRPSISGGSWPRPNVPRSPPRSTLPTSSEYLTAIVAKFAPARSCLTISRACATTCGSVGAVCPGRGGAMLP